MPDLGARANYLVSPTREVELKWQEVAIQEKRDRLFGIKQEIDKCQQMIESIRNGQLISLEASKLMLEQELAFLQTQKRQLEERKLAASVNVG